MELVFAIGGAYRRVFINGRKIGFLTAEIGYTPLVIDLDKLESGENKSELKKIEASKEFLKELRELKTENEIAKDIIKDFQKSGWRLVKRKNGK